MKQTKKRECNGYESFKTIAETIQANYGQVLNFFNNRSTNASAESFNAKIKSLRAQLRGVTDVKYFLFRLTNIYAYTHTFTGDPLLLSTFQFQP